MPRQVLDFIHLEELKPCFDRLLVLGGGGGGRRLLLA